MSVDHVREGGNYVIMKIDENRMPIFTHVTCKSEIIDFKFCGRFIETMDGKRYLLDDVYLSEEDAKKKYIEKIKNNINSLEEDIYFAEFTIKTKKENLKKEKILLKKLKIK